jgi:glycosyltransferase involved in cell wall biosynthesis
MSPTLTLAIPYYSRPDYLKEAVQSVLGQNDADWHLLIVDDRGPDPSGGEWAASLKDPRIRYVKNDRNLGITANWNRCLDLVDTDLVTLFHSDDVLEPNYVGMMKKAAVDYPQASAFFCQTSIIDARSRSTFSFPDWYKSLIIPSTKEDFVIQGESGFSSLLGGDYIMCPTLCFRRAKLRGERFDETRVTTQDFEFIMRFLAHGHSLVGLAEKAYRYRRHSENVTSKSLQDMRMLQEEADFFLLLESWAKDRGWAAATRRARRRSIVRNKALFHALRDLTKGDWAGFRRKIRFARALR